MMIVSNSGTERPGTTKKQSSETHTAESSRESFTSMDPDELYTLRNRFWLGSFQSAIAEGNNLNRLNSEELKIERDEFVYRSYVGLGKYNLVVGEIKDDGPIQLVAVKLLAEYMQDPDGSGKQAIEKFGELLEDPVKGANTTLQLLAAIAYDKESDKDRAFTAIKDMKTMEQMAYWTQLCLGINRVDLAADVAKKLVAIDEDATLAQLASAWVHIAQGGDKLKEAAYTYEELIDKFEPTVSLLNGLAAAHMHMGDFEEAEKHLQLALQKNDDPDTLINLIATSAHLGKEDQIIERYQNQLTSQFPHHPVVKKLERSMAAFDRVAEQYEKQIDPYPDDGYVDI